MCSELEEMMSSGAKRFDLLICGSLYTIDLESMTQAKKDCHRQARKMLRELPSRVYRRGVAGLRK
jgi:hypothetical protein